MPRVIRLRDVARATVCELGPDVPMLRGPYDLNPSGPVRRVGALIEWVEAGTACSGRTASGVLGEAETGQRVLVQVPPLSGDDEWWLCEVETVDDQSVGQ